MDVIGRGGGRHVPRPLPLRASTDPDNYLKGVAMPTAQPKLHHLALTVSDLDRSVRWYCGVFGLGQLMDAPHPGGVGKILADPAQQLMIALHHHDASGGE